MGTTTVLEMGNQILAFLQNIDDEDDANEFFRIMMDALEAKDAEAGNVAFRTYCSVLDKAAKGGVIKKNTAVRRKTNAANGLRKIAS